MTLCFWVVSVSSFFSPPSHTAEQFYVKPNTISVSHLNHPATPPFRRLIKQVYDDLGIDVRFYEVPALRGFIELNNGHVDADVVRIDTNAARYANILVVQPALYTAELVLICPIVHSCDKSALSDPNAITISNLGNMMVLDDLFINGSILNSEVYDFDDVRYLLNNGRVDYAIYGVTESLKKSIEREFKVTELSKVSLHHVIHKRHAPLLPEIQDTLESYLNSFDPDTDF